MNRERIEGAIEALEKISAHDGFVVDAAMVVELSLRSLRAKLAALPPESEQPWTERELRLREALGTLNHAAKVAVSTEYGASFEEDTPLTIRLLDGTCDATDEALAEAPPPDPRDVALETAQTSLITARAAFRFYAEHHASKGDTARAGENSAYADEMNRALAAIARARGGSRE